MNFFKSKLRPWLKITLENVAASRLIALEKVGNGWFVQGNEPSPDGEMQELYSALYGLCGPEREVLKVLTQDSYTAAKFDKAALVWIMNLRPKLAADEIEIAGVAIAKFTLQYGMKALKHKETSSE